MLKNFFSVAIRHLLIHKYYSAINIAGLAVALAAFLLIGLYVISEFSYDRHHPDSERIYRVERDFILADQDELLPGNSEAVGALLKANFPEVEDFTRIFPHEFRMGREDQFFYENEVRAVDSNHFDFFQYTWLQGNPDTALSMPFTVVLTETLARKYFGDKNPMGEILILDGSYPFTVTGLIQDVPANTHITATAFASLSSMAAIEGEFFFYHWNVNNFHTYIRLQSGISYSMIAESVRQYLFDVMPQEQDGLWDFTGLNVADIHLYSPTDRGELSQPGNINNLRALILIGAGLLMIACINFINITTARSSRRGKEVAIKKTVGSGSKVLMAQFWGESLLHIILAFCVALPMVELALPALNGFLGKEIALDLWRDSGGMSLLIGSALALAVIAGGYPAFYLAKLRPLRILRGQQGHSSASVALRSLLVIGQFTVSIALLIATGVITMQLQLGREIDLGFNKDRIVVLEGMRLGGIEGWMQKGFDTQWQTLKNELLLHPGISNVTRSNIKPFAFGENGFTRRDILYEGGPEGGLDMTVMMVDFDFFETYQIPLIAGRTFSERAGLDVHTQPLEENSGTYIINAAAAAQFGWTPEAAIGKWLYNNQHRIVGVVENTKLESVREAAKPIHYYIPTEDINESRPFAAVRLSGNNLPATLAYIDTTWNRLYPEEPIRRTFLDTDFDAIYLQDTQFGRFVGFISLLTVLIACLGLHGLAAYTVEQRTKEIGVRKVMGSSVWNIIVLFANDFGRLVLLSNLIAWPIAYYAMERWLQNFAYRIELTPLIFIGSGLIALCIAWVTVGGTAAKAASAKPVLSLRYE